MRSYHHYSRRAEYITKLPRGEKRREGNRAGNWKKPVKRKPGTGTEWEPGRDVSRLAVDVAVSVSPEKLREEAAAFEGSCAGLCRRVAWPPQAIAERWRREWTGDLEGDTLHGGIGKGCLLTLVDRKTRKLYAVRGPDDGERGNQGSVPAGARGGNGTDYHAGQQIGVCGVPEN
jgi:hypothetical protein